MGKYLIYAIFFFALFANSLFQLGIPKYFAVGTEILIYLLLIYTLLKKIGRGFPIPHLWYSFVLMVIVGACSIVINDSSLVRSIFSLRLLYRFYFFYLGIILLEPNDQELKKIINYIAILLVLQLPVVAAKFYYYGISELTIGAYSDVGGSVTTMLPIIIIFYLAGYYFLYNSDLRYIILTIAFILFSIVGKKRAVAFLYPLQFLAIFYYIYVKGKKVAIPRKIVVLFLIIASVITVTSSILYINETLNPEKKVGGTVDYKYAVEYAVDYTTRYNAYGYSGGRLSTTTRIFEKLWEAGPDIFLFGFGPGSTVRSIFDQPGKKKDIQRFFEKLQIAYGVTPMCKIALEYGVLGVFAFFLIIFSFTRMCWRFYKNEIDPYWKAFAAGSVGFAFSMVFFFFAYHYPAIFGDTIPCLYFFAMAVVHIKLKQMHI
jgi:hypothetical protein